LISFSNLGNYGRLGNQMFQYAAMLGISDKTGLEFGFSPGLLLDCFDIKLGKVLESQIQPKYLYSEPDFSFSSRVFDCPDDVDFIGYFQSEKYWQHCREKVVDQFQFIDKLESDSNFASVHIRRGDYVSLKDTHACLADTDYYDLALESLNSHKIVVFTDDKEWFTSSGLLEKWSSDRDVSVSDNVSDSAELQHMSKASDAIIANSSFSWWGAYLGPHQKRGRVIAPSMWFGPNGPKIWKDIYCDGWEII
jgi:hypothetical protein